MRKEPSAGRAPFLSFGRLGVPGEPTCRADPPSSARPPSDARTATLQGLLIGAIVIAALYVGREVLLPLALAILLSFVLTPPLLAAQAVKVPRVLAVGIVVATAFGIIFALGWLMSREATQLAAELPNYRATLSEKIQSLPPRHGERRPCCKRRATF